MSIFDTIGRCGAVIRKAHQHSQAMRMLNELPPEIQKDIGWPVTPRERRREIHLMTSIWGAAR